ncbi:hypothetical protein BDN70DRAFT_939130 [Pholiota conissans]|uniref:Uncharacterized protein n=1 Tax=Pholiota conissans TaxID=109636 RepID=A0A9P5YLV0_9AGAR|nr:hypothetical protein BDN70DRAFT_939130 [Pholiota conissans]
MRFFKTFKILHRRGGSATFVSGPPLEQLVPPTCFSSSSVGKSPGNRTYGTPTKGIFQDMVTSRVPPVHHPQSDHVAETTPRFWDSKRQSRRTSMMSLHSVVDNEHSRLKEAAAYWIQEHSKLRSILNNCHADLVTERQKNLALERNAEMDAHIIADLRTRLAQRTALSGEAKRLSGYYASEQVYQDPSITIIPASRPSKPPSLDEYTNALRLTLATRKELREQKKATKFWKQQASSFAELELITPSISTISSIRETLPAERQTALHALVVRRGFAVKLGGLVELPLFEKPSELASDIPLSFDVLFPTTPDIPSPFPSSSVNSSIYSRLPPLASEYMKTEIDLMSGSSSRDSSKLLSSLSCKGRSRSASISTREFSKKFSPEKSLSSKAHSSCSTSAESACAGLDSTSESTIKVVQPIEVDQHNIYDRSFLRSVVTSWSSAFVHIYGNSSRIFGRRSEDLSRGCQNPTPIGNHGVKQASKECTPRRSWKHYPIASAA